MHAPVRKSSWITLFSLLWLKKMKIMTLPYVSVMIVNAIKKVDGEKQTERPFRNTVIHSGEEQELHY